MEDSDSPQLLLLLPTDLSSLHLKHRSDYWQLALTEARHTHRAVLSTLQILPHERLKQPWNTGGMIARPVVQRDKLRPGEVKAFAPNQMARTHTQAG